MNLVPELVDCKSEMTDWRRRLHAKPETAFEEHDTADIIAAKLAEFGIETRRGYAATGVIGTLRCGNSDRSVAFRSELDAINVQEENRFEHRSKVDGKMHGCGHDGHMVMLLAAARQLAQQRNFDGTLHFIFQPGEEVGNGAKRMMDDGLFDAIDPESIYGMHNFPGLDVGKFATRTGDFMASLDAFTITIHGKGGHGAYPSKACNPIAPACTIVSALNEQVALKIPSDEVMSLSVAEINSGSAINVIPQTAIIRGTVRALSDDAQDRMENAIHTLTSGICQAYGVEGEVSYERTYPRLVNAERQTELAADVACQLAGTQQVQRDWLPMMASEDFAWMLLAKPGNYIAIGNGTGSNGGTFVHHPEYDFNDEILALGASYWVRLAEKLL